MGKKAKSTFKHPKINKELQAFLPEHTPEQVQSLEAKILAEGMTERIKVAEDGDIIDGYGRLAICRKHKIAYKYEVVNGLKTMDEKKWWMIVNQTSRRNLTDEQLSYFRGRMYEYQKQASEERIKAIEAAGQDDREPIDTSEEVGKQFGVSGRTVRRDAEFAAAVDAAAEKDPAAREVILSGQVTQAEIRRATSQAPSERLCERCTRVGKTKGCEQCKALKALPVTPGGTNGKKAKSGEVAFNYKRFLTTYGQLSRCLADFGKSFPKEKGSREVKKCGQLLDEFQETFDRAFTRSAK